MRISNPHYVMGQWNAICDRCGQQFKSGELRKEWTGLRVCKSCWEPRHPQDFVKGKADRRAPAWVRPRTEGVDVSPGSGNEITADDL